MSQLFLNHSASALAAKRQSSMSQIKMSPLSQASKRISRQKETNKTKCPNVPARFYHLCPSLPSPVVLICPRQPHNYYRKHQNTGQSHTDHNKRKVRNNKHNSKNNEEHRKNTYQINPGRNATHGSTNLSAVCLRMIVYQVTGKH